jgi:hypothetical protein
VVESIFVDEEL